MKITQTTNGNRITEILWDNVICGVICTTAAILYFYTAAVILFNLDWKLIGSLQRDIETCSTALILGVILMIPASIFFFKTKDIYGYVGK